MQRFAFRKGLRFLCQATGSAWTIMKQTVTNKIVLENKDGETKPVAPEELIAKWHGREWLIDETCLAETSNVFYESSPKDLRCLSERQQQLATRRLKYIESVERAFSDAGGSLVCTMDALKAKIPIVAKELNDPAPPSASTLYRWFARFRATRCVTKLVDLRERAGRKVSQVLMSLFEEAVSEKFLVKLKYPSKEVWLAVLEKVESANRGVAAHEQLPRPSKPTIYRWLKKLHFELVLRAREGKAATERELRSAVAKLKIAKILERAEIDHTPLDILVIDVVTRLILGRPWLTLCIDRKSRCVLGFYISFHAPSAYSVLYCIRQAILPKDQILARFPDVRNPWPCRGIPDQLVCDNGMDLHADAVEAACLEMGIDLLYCGAGNPAMKGAIERMMRTLNHGLIHQLPGTVFSNPEQRGDYPSEAEAAIDLDTLVHLVVKWIVDEYHVLPHRGLNGLTPLQTWQTGEAERTIELPVYPQQLDTIVAGAAERVLFHYGVEYDCLRYNSPLLQSIKRKRGGTPQVHVRFYEHDVGHIDVLDPETEEFIRIPAVDQDYASGLNRHIHRLVRAEAAKRFGSDYPHESLLLVKREIQEIVDKAVSAKKAGDRKKAAAVKLHDSNQTLEASPNQEIPATRPVSIAGKAPASLPSELTDDLPDLPSTTHAMEEYA